MAGTHGSEGVSSMILASLDFWKDGFLVFVTLKDLW